MKNLEFRRIENFKELDSFVNSSNYRYFTQTSSWYEFLKSVGKEVDVIGGYNDNELVISALVQVETSRFGKIIYLQRAPILDWQSDENNNYVKQLLNYLQVQYNPVFVRMDPYVLEEEKNTVDYIKKIGFKDAEGFWMPYRCWVIELKGSTEEKILSDMRKNHRYYVRKGEKAGLDIYNSKDLADMQEFVDMLHKLSIRKGFVAHSKEYLLKQFEIMSLRDDNFRLYVAKKDGKLIAGAVVSFYEYEAAYIHGASDDPENTFAPYTLQWVMIKEALNAGIQRYNFWGVVEDKNYVPSYPGYGYSNFKKGFGGYLRLYIKPQDYVFKPIQYLLFNLQEKYRKWKFKGN